MHIRVAKVVASAFWLLALVASTASAQVGRQGELLVGDWRGLSVCQVKPSACHDEDSLYHIRSVPRKGGWFTMQADRVTNGKIVNMGTVDCSYTAADHLLQCDLPQGTIRLVLDGERLMGTMTLPDNTVWRKITLNRQISN